jgi:hypothetical protein
VSSLPVPFVVRSPSQYLTPREQPAGPGPETLRIGAAVAELDDLFEELQEERDASAVLTA